MKKKEIIFALIIFILMFSLLTLLLFIMIEKQEHIISNNGTNTQTIAGLGPLKESIPTIGNDMVLKTHSETKIRIVNEYNKNVLTAKKNLFIMFASWCPSCKEEITEIENIINEYKDNKDVNVIVIAHEFNQSDYPLEGLISLLENDVNYGDFEIWVDFDRVIRKELDPEASTIPISYVVDKNGKILSKHESTLTLEKAKEMLK